MGEEGEEEGWEGRTTPACQALGSCQEAERGGWSSQAWAVITPERQVSDFKKHSSERWWARVLCMSLANVVS